MNNPNDFNFFFFLFPFVILVVVITTLVLVFRAQQARLRIALEAVAARWQGRAYDGGLFGNSFAELQISGLSARLQFKKPNKQTLTELTIHFPDGRLRLEIYPQTIVHQVGKLLGMQDIEVGRPAFDDAFIIQGNDLLLIREYLSLESQAAIQALASFTFYYNLHLTISGGTLRVTKQGVAQRELELVTFISAFETLFLALVSTRTLGIEFLPTTAPPRVSTSHCQVCGEGLQGPLVYCASCQTPHHLECWQYVGACSVYACGQKRYRATPK